MYVELKQVECTERKERLITLSNKISICRGRYNEVSWLICKQSLVSAFIYQLLVLTNISFGIFMTMFGDANDGVCIGIYLKLRKFA